MRWSILLALLLVGCAPVQYEPLLYVVIDKEKELTYIRDDEFLGFPRHDHTDYYFTLQREGALETMRREVTAGQYASFTVGAQVVVKGYEIYTPLAEQPR